MWFCYECALIVIYCVMVYGVVVCVRVCVHAFVYCVFDLFVMDGVKWYGLCVRCSFSVCVCVCCCFFVERVCAM